MPVPSVATLRRLFPNEHWPKGRGSKAVKLRRLLDGRDNPENYKSVQDWKRQCHNWPPSTPEMVMCAANELLKMHGVEAIECQGWHGSYHHNIHATYCNTGDSYGLTLLHDSARDEYLVTSWGDYVEREERREPECFPREEE